MSQDTENLTSTSGGQEAVLVRIARRLSEPRDSEGRKDADNGFKRMIWALIAIQAIGVDTSNLVTVLGLLL